MTTPRPFRFGLGNSMWPSGEGDLRALLHDEARRAELAGFDVMTFADHVIDGMRPPLATIVSAAEATSTLRFGTLVLNNDFWNPVMLAREVTAIAALTGGRFELGIGAGHAQPDYDAAGLSYDGRGTRVDRLSEAVPLLRSLLDGETVTHQGRHYSCNEATNGLVGRSAQRRIPLLIGGNGERVLRLAGEHADIVGVTGLVRNVNNGHVHQPTWTNEYLDERIDIVRTVAGPRFASMELNALVQRVVETSDRVAAAAAFCDELALLGITVSVADALTTPFLLFGTIDEMADQLHATRDRFGISYFTTRADAADVMTRVIARCRRALTLPRPAAPIHPFGADHAIRQG